jgi:hypothetical protein
MRIILSYFVRIHKALVHDANSSCKSLSHGGATDVHRWNTGQPEPWDEQKSIIITCRCEHERWRRRRISSNCLFRTSPWSSASKLSVQRLPSSTSLNTQSRSLSRCVYALTQFIFPNGKETQNSSPRIFLTDLVQSWVAMKSAHVETTEWVVKCLCALQNFLPTYNRTNLNEGGERKMSHRYA